MNTYKNQKIRTLSGLATNYYNKVKEKITQTKNQEQSAKSFLPKSKTSKERNIAAKKSIVNFTTNSKATVKLTRISVTEVQQTEL